MSDANPTSPSAQRPSKKVSWALINFYLDVCLLLNFLVLMWVSAILQFVFPPGVNARGWRLWNADVVAWQNFQFETLCVLTAGITLHVMFHWSWICGVINRQVFKRTVIQQNGSDTLIGVGLIAVIIHVLAIGVLVARWAIEH